MTIELLYDTRSVDDLGRVIIPKAIREKYRIEEGDEVAFRDQGDCIVIEKVRSSCCICHSLEDLTAIDSSRNICGNCIARVNAL
ncbi:AbrB/MazE/SpoVT family DNA-binding domain-containing protein [Ruminococcaceae bacterium OttesenSCG-928-L11]|nr:AbrB/MazE/SpoVT family DNA-binding domain-containing protein [Ruminococcaceae bacterium OttesenSCG-928-L11]